MGGVIRPLLANRFLHYAFDVWRQRKFAGSQVERDAAEVLDHCRSQRQAGAVLEAIRGRFAQCGLELHPTKPRIVYCKAEDRPGEHEHLTLPNPQERPRLFKK